MILQANKIKILSSLLLLLSLQIFAQEAIPNHSYLLLLNADKGEIILEKDSRLISKKAAQEAILDESLEPYFSQLQHREMECFIQEKIPVTNLNEARIYTKNKFASVVLPFSEEEIQSMTFLVQEINTILWENNLGLMARQDWKFIKIADWLCGGFAHTRGDFIILSQKHLNHLSKDWSTAMSEEGNRKLLAGIGSLIVHEQMHGLQRNNPKIFKKLYTKYWDFHYAKVEAIDEITLNQVSNPDAPMALWLIPNPKVKDEYYWPRTLLKAGVDLPQMGKDFEDVVFMIEKKGNSYQLELNEQGCPLSIKISDIPFYSKSFPVTRGIDHPNEIAAYMFADYYKALVLGEEPFGEIEESAQENTQAFIDWLLKEMD